MFVKYQHVRNGVLVAALAGAGAWWFLTPSAPEAEPAPSGLVAASGSPSRPATPGGSPPGADPLAAAAPEPPAAPATQVRDPLLTLAGVLLEGRAPSDKIKDYLKGQGAKFNLYDDDKDGRWDRAKIDFDRDEVWDEKWTRKNDTVERQLEVSGNRLVLRDGRWEVLEK
jgi:hypothetical protein